MAIHKQVKYKDFEVDEEMLPIIQLLNENGIETLYSCCGLDETGNKNKKSKDKKDDFTTYIVIKKSDKARVFVDTLCILQDYILEHIYKQKNIYPSPLVVIQYSCFCGEFRYVIRAINTCTFNDFNKIITETIRTMQEIQKNMQN